MVADKYGGLNSLTFLINHMIIIICMALVYGSPSYILLLLFHPTFKLLMSQKLCILKSSRPTSYQPYSTGITP